MKITAISKVAVTGLLAVGLAGGGCKSNPQPAPAAAPVASTNPKVPVQGTMNPDGSFTPNAVQPGTQGTMNPDSSFTPNPSPQPTPAPQTAVAPPPPAPAPLPVREVPAPVASAPAPAPAPVYRTVPAGTPVTATITQSLSASKNEVGDGFSGVLASPITVGGRTIFARGTRVAGTVVAAKGRGRFKGSGAIGIELTSIGGERVSTSEYEKESKGRGKRSAGFIGGGAGIGALIGGLAGGGKGALIGGLAGGGGGTAAAAYTGDRDVVIPSESTVTFRLNSALRVR